MADEEVKLESYGNPKHLIGESKIPLHLWPPIASAYGCLAMMDGKGKYGRSNFRASPVFASIYIAAAARHLAEYLEGIDVAADSGIDHRGHILACMAILVDAEMVGTLVDDRNFNGKNYTETIEKLTKVVKVIAERHKDKDPRHYTIKDNNGTT